VSAERRAQERAAGALQTLLVTPEGRADPYPLYEDVRAAGPVLRAADDLLVVIGYAEVSRALRDPRLLVHDMAIGVQQWPEWGEHSSLRSLGNSLLETNSPDHERMRRLVNGAFTPRRLAHMSTAIAGIVSDLIDAMGAGAERGSIDFMASFAYPLPINVICEFLGVPVSDRAWFRPVAHDLTATLEPMMNDLGPADAASDVLHAYFTDLIAAKRLAPGDDLTSMLVATHDAQPDQLSGEELLSNLTLLLLAGFETTANLLGNGLRVLLERPTALASLRSMPALAADHVEEMLRFDSPVQLTSRHVAQPIEVFGHPMPAGSEIYLMIGGANRDPGRFHAPDRYDPFRADNAPISFGAGAHYCVGNALARMEAQAAFPMLLERFPGIAAAGEPERKDRITLRGYTTLPVAV
jgi:cytochrome P450